MKNKKLNSLFDKWSKENPYYKESFIKDGIIDENEFDGAKLKILYICKEPNDPNKDSWDFREEWSNDRFYYTFAYRIAEWSHGVLNDFPPYDEIWPENSFKNVKKALKQVAFMNIKKSGGGGSSDKGEMINHLNVNYDFLHKQIDIISPDIIILGLSWEELTEGLFPDAKWVESGYSVSLGKYKNYKIIDFYHPSARIPGAASYSLIQNIIQSDVFKNL